MKPTFKEQLLEEIEVLLQLLENSTDEKQQDAIIKMVSQLIKYVNKNQGEINVNIDFMKLNYTEEDRLKDEIHYEETMIARLNVMLGFAMTPVDLETILHQIDLHQKRLQVFEDELREYNRHRYTISGKCE